MNARVVMLGYASGIGARDPGCGDGPLRLRTSGLDEMLQARGVDAVWGEIYFPEPRRGETVRDTIQRLNKRLTLRVTEVLQGGGRPLVLGGDHSSAVGTWRGVLTALGADKKLGLLWIDAHLDAHTPETTHTGMIHGMPLAVLLGRLGRGGPGQAVVRPGHVAIVGARSFEAEEAMLLRELGVRVYGMEEIEQRGLAEVLREAHARVARETDAYGISVDIDSLDPNDAPGVGTPEPGGLRAGPLLAALAEITAAREPVALEIAEFNPHHDREDRTLRIVHEIAAVLTGAAQQDSPAEVERRYGVSGEATLPLVLVRGEGVWLWDQGGRRYLDMMAAYATVNHGHVHPRLVQALMQQAHQLTLGSHAFHNDRLPALLARLCQLLHMDRALALSTGAEAVEAALKAARKWAYRVKRVPEGKAEIIACEGGYHGQSITLAGMSSEAGRREGFGPYPKGFKLVPYGDAVALERAVTPHTAAFVVEPIQGESGIVVPPAGYLAQCKRICEDNGVLFLADEVQTGLGRTGAPLACDHEGVRPDGLMLGKALGGGMLPVSAFLARADLMSVLGPDDLGSTFAGNPLAAAVALEALNVMVEEHYAQRAAALGERLLTGLRAIHNPLVREVRGRGLLIGMELDVDAAGMRTVLERLTARGILSCPAARNVVRLSPPLVIQAAQIDWAIDEIAHALHEAHAAIGDGKAQRSTRASRRTSGPMRATS
ncbi:MAG: ornithine--oxo-acid transaminase [Pseudomonadota bacterium]|nr:MAG: ornithine--oxo-acid transaminase [Pseudomonadota bacterium]